MTRRPLAIGVLAFGASVVGAAAFAWNPGLFDQAAAAVVLMGMIIAAATGLVGLVLARAPWGRWALLATVMISAILASVGGTWLFWATVALAAVAIVALAGPWLRLWVRRQPAADAPGSVVIALISIAPAAPLFVGMTALDGLHVAHLLLIAVAVIGSWAYGRGLRAGIWGLRLALPIAGLFATLATDGAGTWALAIAVVAVTILAWSPQARQATAVITPPLPEPVKRTPRSDTNASD